MKITGAQAIVKALELESADIIFGYPGSAICPFYDALIDSKITHVLTRNEQGAAHAASGYARATGKTGVCIATSGPGSTNLITGIATAYMDSIPLVAITGQVSSELIGRDSFQESVIPKILICPAITRKLQLFQIKWKRSVKHLKMPISRLFVQAEESSVLMPGMNCFPLQKNTNSPLLLLIAVSGDGSLQMSIEELGTIKQQGLGVKIILFNNSRLGMVREMQKVKFCGRYSQVYMEHNPDFQMLAKAYGLNSRKITINAEVMSALEEMLSDESPYLLECIVDSVQTQRSKVQRTSKPMMDLSEACYGIFLMLFLQK